MDVKELNKRDITDGKKRLFNVFDQFDRLLGELRKRNVPEDIVSIINKEIEIINGVTDSEKKLRKQIRNSQTKILRLLEKQLKLVSVNYYRNTWLVVGMAAFGIPLGAAYGSITGNMAFIGIGLPIGMALGMAVGAGMDKKALKEGRQLDIEIKHN